MLFVLLIRSTLNKLPFNHRVVKGFGVSPVHCFHCADCGHWFIKSSPAVRVSSMERVIQQWIAHLSNHQLTELAFVL